ncbi:MULTISPECIES: DUF397 domain-containing protein [unclassified Streptomyces]|uniref:DUF397 domain-containing protein n=1 Tax=unclassified Streptomyces TaxID=2593676 RepID=UPI001BE708F5|nr:MULTISPECIES: DUF397 domain-containing protein [unclassified Streptomyces]MBT2407108.1 DUF397 domain-containing protein [Streptomyces sp. ISL-21]MBT2455894.1 DUF397 domain-containing protein [Streptomyces sp. ISL-86]MBT2613192.1 DUF397 domain-containing protein [Streptomyces sp. ISL-87]
MTSTSEYDLSTATWHKSSYSGGDGGNCVEVARDFPGAAAWRKSTYSDGTGGDCVEVADGHACLVPVRDSKRPEGPHLTFHAPAWTAFVAAL